MVGIINNVLSSECLCHSVGIFIPQKDEQETPRSSQTLEKQLSIVTAPANSGMEGETWAISWRKTGSSQNPGQASQKHSNFPRPQKGTQRKHMEAKSAGQENMATKGFPCSLHSATFKQLLPKLLLLSTASLTTSVFCIHHFPLFLNMLS